MAIYRLEAKIIGRKARGFNGYGTTNRQTSVVAKAAYRSGEKLKDERNNATFDYAAREQEVAHSEIIAPEPADGWLRAGLEANEQREVRERLWNAIERVEKRRDSQLAREFVVSLPKELALKEGTEIVRQWCSSEFVSKGFIVDFSVHKSKNGSNPHAHVLCTLRPVDGAGFGKKPDMSGKFKGRGAAGHGAKSDLMGWRESWERFVNAGLEKAGRSERVDHRSLKDQGIDRAPEPKIGVEATAMERRGVVKDSEPAKRARETRFLNELRPFFRSLNERGHIQEIGTDMTWGQRTMTVVGRIRDYAAGLVKRGWQKLIAGQRHQDKPMEMERD